MIGMPQRGFEACFKAIWRNGEHSHDKVLRGEIIFNQIMLKIYKWYTQAVYKKYSNKQANIAIFS